MLKEDDKAWQLGAHCSARRSACLGAVSGRTFDRLCVGGLVYGVIQVGLADQWHILGSVWWVFPACLFPFLVAWAGYFKERKAEKLRSARNLSRPVE